MKPKLPNKWCTKLDYVDDARELVKAGGWVIDFGEFISRGIDFWNYPTYVDFREHTWESFYKKDIDIPLKEIISMLIIEDFVNPKQKEE